MESVRSQRITWGKWIALFALLAVALLALMTPRAAEAGNCYSLAQNITKLKHVSCQSARKLVNSAYRANAGIPECRGDSTIRFKGWKFKAIGHRDITVRVTKGHKRFILSGGGAC